MFIKGENVKLKMHEQQLRDAGQGSIDEEDEMDGDSDSSADSDESSKNILV